MTSIIILTIGIPGSGKTTWCKQYQKEHPYVYYISTDEIRKEMRGTDEFDPNENEIIHMEAVKRVREIIQDKKNYGGNKGMGPVILVDSTNTKIEDWIVYRNLEPTIMIAKFFDVPPAKSLELQRHRERQVPFDKLEYYWQNIEKYRKCLRSFFNMIL